MSRVAPLCPQCKQPFASLSSRDKRSLALANDFPWICGQCFLVSSASEQVLPLEQAMAQERGHYLSLLTEALNQAETQPDILEICEGLRKAYSPSSPVRYAWARVSPELLCELWAAMERMGGSIPDRPDVFQSAASVDESYIQQVLQAISDAVRWCNFDAKTLAAPSQAEKNVAVDPKTRGTKKRRGAPVVSDELADRRLCADWKAAKSQGMTRGAFTREKGMNVSDLIAAQDREKYRRQRDAE